MDIVGALLDRLPPRPPPAEGAPQADAHRSLARRLVCRGDDEAVHVAAESTSPSARLRGRNGSTLSATTVRVSASATPPVPSASSGRLGVYAATTPSKKLLATTLPGNITC